jgi:hypothetical protein
MDFQWPVTLEKGESNMKTYEHHRIQRLAEQLENAKIDGKIAVQILEGGENIKKTTKPEKKADWFRESMFKMDNLLDFKTRKAVREGCACCLGGKRLKISQKIAKENTTLEDRVKAANESHLVFGHGVTMDESGEIVVRFYPEGQEHYRCVCLSKAEKPLPLTYCYCCGGHVKHHLQIALGRGLDCTTKHTALSSGGKLGCVFSFKIME